MVISWSASWFLTNVLSLIIQSSLLIDAENLHYPSIVNSPVSWSNVPPYDLGPLESAAGVMPILVNQNFTCGFHCTFIGESCLFAISILIVSFDLDAGDSSPSPQIVWSANRNNPVDYKAVLRFTQEGDLILQDGTGALVWSTNTTAKSAPMLNLTNEGNLVLLDKTNNVIWQSFDHPTDSLVPGQSLVYGKKLRSSSLESNSSEDLYSFTIDDDGKIVAYIETDPPQVYYRSYYGVSRKKKGQIYAEFQRIASGWFWGFSLEAGELLHNINVVKLGSDGHLKGYKWTNSSWTVMDLLPLDTCDYPLACGKYGFCSEGNCSCYGIESDVANTYSYLKPTNYKQLELGCSLIQPIACEFSHDQILLEVQNHVINGFTLASFIKIYDAENCKQACLKNCSCKAVIFRQYSNLSTDGSCSLASEVFSLGWNYHYYEGFYNFSIFIKVQNFPVAQTLEKNLLDGIHTKKTSENVAVIMGSILGSIFSVLLLCTASVLLLKNYSRKDEEDYLDQMPGMPTRFSYEELKVVTKNFSKKLGEGGFGSVFHGTIPTGIEVAVKHLDGFGPVNKSFITEVQTIGSIHHFNLISLVGFCAEKFRRLLIYEYMCNGSLDQWIFTKNKEIALSWQSRKKIILDIAKGLAYLHEDCKQRIIHLDIKPQNILLDENFNAKVSDFGLSKLIGRNQSEVVTTMRGTPGYMAPEWLSSVITEKVDVYSFGIVLLEILSGRGNVDRSQPEEDMHLVSLFKRKAEEDRLLDLVDKYSDDMQSNAAEVVEHMKVAACCLQSESGRRPSMSVLVKVFEGSTNIENCFSYDFSSLPGAPESAATLSLTLPSILSGPR